MLNIIKVQVITACFSYIPPDLNLSELNLWLLEVTKFLSTFSSSRLCQNSAVLVLTTNLVFSLSYVCTLEGRYGKS